MAARSVNHRPLDVWRRQTVEIRVCVQGCEVLEKGLEVLIGIFNILQNKSRQSKGACLQIQQCFAGPFNASGLSHDQTVAYASDSCSVGRSMCTGGVGAAHVIDRYPATSSLPQQLP